MKKNRNMRAVIQAWLKRHLLQTAYIGGLSFLVNCHLDHAAPPEKPQRKPNIIVILSDDHGYSSVGCQGLSDIPTPNIDSIARNGIRFTNGYVTCPICSPSRAGLLTGRYQQRFGHEDNPGPIPVCSPNFGLPTDEKTMADYLKEEGYATGMVGKWHLGHRPELHPQNRGFDEFFGFLHGAHSYLDPGLDSRDPIVRGNEKVDEKEYLTDAFAREAASFIERHKNETFFLYLPFNAIHSPDEAPERLEGKFTEIEHPARRTWAKMLTALDEGVGRLLTKVREEGLEDNTLIFFLGDNGGYPVGGIDSNIPLRGRKADTFEGGIRVPFMVQWKGRLDSGKVYENPVISLDILPTSLAAAGGDINPVVEGVNLLPYLKGENPGNPHDSLFWRLCKKSGARVGDWKLVDNGDGKEMLFNLADDIGEQNDLSISNPEKFKEMKSAYRDWDSKNIEPKWLDGRKTRKRR
ncbi:sulfatase-like hydrolase/transferase [Candidatus Sumerlaeota bacterium]|nr:sulfatase-like hydrolase/transferase [Candidatus Sumerlaeota bacterium]